MAGWYWWLVLVFEYIEGVFERVEDVFEKKVGTQNRSIGMLGWLGKSRGRLRQCINPLRSIDFRGNTSPLIPAYMELTSAPIVAFRWWFPGIGTCFPPLSKGGQS